AAQSLGSEGADIADAAEIGANEPLAEWERELLEGTRPDDRPPAAKAAEAATADPAAAASDAPASGVIDPSTNGTPAPSPAA
ncbi:MAG: 30S ribosomal protein S2, partial [Actinomycetota bacterium]|nr:30S ribosomal protein S2 [Actinomycetota bacterium]